MIYAKVVLLFLFFASTTWGALPRHGRRSRPVTQTQATLAAMFGASPHRGPCHGLRMRNSLRQHRMCRNEHGIPITLHMARKLAVNNCEEQFQYDRWNCSIFYGKTYFFAKEKVYRETALMNSMAAASLTHCISRACAEGKLKRCTCAELESEMTVEDTNHRWHWGGCGDNLQYGRRFTRQFLQLKHVGDDLNSNTLRHNIEVGIKVVAQQLGDVCKCHGVSGSCTTKTCWRRLAPFTQTAAVLKTRYHQAIRNPSNRASRRQSTLSQHGKTSAYSPLLYLEKSPSFCNVTRDRRCLEPDNCATLCCGRGYNTLVANSTRSCNCHWKQGYVLHCAKCAYTHETYTCK